MAEKLGIGFVIGATVGSSVAAAFATVESKLKATQQAFSNASRAAKLTHDAIAAKEKRDAAISAYKASDGKDARLIKAVRDASKEYAKASKAAAAYGRTVEEWRIKQLGAAAAVETTNAKIQRLRGIQDERARRQELRGQMVETVAPMAAVVAPVKLAIDFESSMADAAKTMEGMRDAVGNLTPKYYEMQNIIKGMGRELPLAHTEIARLFAAGGQLGISDVSELKQFATMAAHMSVAFGMSAEETADAIGTFRTSLKMNLSDVGSVLDLMNQYANTSSAKEKDIAETLRRIGSLGSVAGVSAKPMTALAATLAAVGTAPDVAATAIKNMMLSMVSGTAATKGQREAYAKLGIDVIKLSKQMQKDGPAAILSVLQAIKKLEKHEQAAIMKELFGSESLTAITPFLDNMDMAIKNLELAEKTSAYAGAMQKEFANRAKTTANALQLAKNRVTELGINLGSVLLPPINKFLDIIGPGISGIAEWASAHEGLTTALVGAAAGFVGFKVGVMALSYAISGLRTGFFSAQLRVQQFRTGLATLRGGMATLGQSAGRAAGIFSVSWGQAVASVSAGMARMRSGMATFVSGGISRVRTALASLRASAASTSASMASVGTACTTAGARAVTAGTMAQASRAGWAVLRTGIMGIGTALKVAFGPMSLIMTAVALGVDWLIANWEKVPPFFAALWESIKKIFDVALGWFKPVLDLIGKGIGLVGQAWDALFGDEKEQDGKPVQRKSLLERGWDWAFGDDEEDEKAAKPAAVTPVAAKVAPPSVQEALPASQPLREQNEEATVKPVAAKVAPPSVQEALPASQPLREQNEEATVTPVAAKVAPPSVQEALPASQPLREQNEEATVTPVAAKVAPPSVQEALPASQPLVGESNVDRLARARGEGRAETKPVVDIVSPRVAVPTIMEKQEAQRREAQPSAPAQEQPGPRVQKPQAQQAQTLSQPASPTVNVSMDFKMQGMPDAAFAEGVVRALKERKADVERLLSDIVHNQARLAYGR